MSKYELQPRNIEKYRKIHSEGFYAFLCKRGFPMFVIVLAYKSLVDTRNIIIDGVSFIEIVSALFVIYCIVLGSWFRLKKYI